MSFPCQPRFDELYCSYTGISGYQTTFYIYRVGDTIDFSGGSFTNEDNVVVNVSLQYDNTVGWGVYTDIGEDFFPVVGYTNPCRPNPIEYSPGYGYGEYESVDLKQIFIEGGLSTEIQPIPCEDHVIVIQVCNSNGLRDDNFEVFLNNTSIGTIDLNSDDQVGSIFIGYSGGNIDQIFPDFVCPIENMVRYYFDPSLLNAGGVPNTLDLINIQDNGNGNFGSVGIRAYEISGDDLLNPLFISDLVYDGASGENFYLEFSYLCVTTPPPSTSSTPPPSTSSTPPPSTSSTPPPSTSSSTSTSTSTTGTPPTTGPPPTGTQTTPTTTGCCFKLPDPQPPLPKPPMPPLTTISVPPLVLTTTTPPPQLPLNLVIMTTTTLTTTVTTTSTTTQAPSTTTISPCEAPCKIPGF